MSALRANAKAIYKRTWLESWLIGVFSGVLIAAILVLNYFSPTTWILTVPFVILPIFFAAITSHLRLKYNEQLTFGKSLREFGLFYRFPFNSSFSYIGSFFKSLAVFFAFLLLGSSLGFTITIIFKPGLNNSLNALQTIIDEGKGITYDLVYDLLTMNDYALFTYLCVIILPSFFFFSLVLIYFITRNATGVYLRNNIKTNNPQFIKLVQNYVYARYRMKMFKKYMSLNWPIIVLYALGYIGGTVFMMTMSISLFNILAAALAGGVLAISFFLPFYFCNMEAIYLDSAAFYSEGLEFITNRIMRSMDMNAQNVEEQRRRFEELLKKQQEEKEQEEEDKKKDPPMGSN